MFRFAIRDLLWLAVAALALSPDTAWVRADETEDLESRHVSETNMIALQTSSRQAGELLAKRLHDRELSLFSTDDSHAVFSAFIGTYGSASKKDEPARFVGFVEGRLRAPVPSSWERAIGSVIRRTSPNLDTGQLAITTPNAESIVPENERQSSPSQRLGKVTELEIGTILPYRDVSIGMDGDRLVARAKGKNIALPISELKRWCGKFPILAVADGPGGDAYVVLHGYGGDPSPIWRIDSTSGAVLWQNVCWGMGPSRARLQAGGLYETVDLVVGEQIVVFGTSHRGCFIDGFDAGSGHAVTRFSTDLWDYRVRRPNDDADTLPVRVVTPDLGNDP